MPKTHGTIRPRIDVFDPADQLREELKFDWNAYIHHATIALREKMFAKSNCEKGMMEPLLVSTECNES